MANRIWKDPHLLRRMANPIFRAYGAAVEGKALQGAAQVDSGAQRLMANGGRARNRAVRRRPRVVVGSAAAQPPVLRPYHRYLRMEFQSLPLEMPDRGSKMICRSSPRRWNS